MPYGILCRLPEGTPHPRKGDQMAPHVEREEDGALPGLAESPEEIYHPPGEVMPVLRVGSLCTGYGGIELAAGEVFGGVDLRWVADNDPDCVTILQKRFPGVPNLGDLRAICYDEVEPVDLLTAGFPCQDVSSAGGRAGLRAGNRTGLWFQVARAINELHPPLVLLENVAGLLTAGADSRLESCPWCLGDRSAEHYMRAFHVVLGDLAELGYDARWGVVRASDAGAPHRRARVFILAYPGGT